VSTSPPDVVEQILQAASRTLALHGVKGTSASSIAQQSGVARSTVYRLFATKQEIMNAMVEYEFRRFFDELYEVVGRLKTIESVMEQGLMFAHSAVEHHFLLQAILREDPSVLEPALSASATSIEPVIAEIFRPYLPVTNDIDEHLDFLVRMGLGYIATQGRWNFKKKADVRAVVAVELLSGVRTPERQMAPAKVAPLVTVSDNSLRTQIVDAALFEIATGHYQDLSIDRIVDRVQGSRSTIYRMVPGGNQALLDMCAEREASRLYSAVTTAISSESELHAGVLAGLTTIWYHLENHQALQVVMQANPEYLNNRLRFSEASVTYEAASLAVQPLLRRWLSGEQASRLGEWLVRIIVAYWSTPVSYLELSNPASVATFYGRHMEAGVTAIAEGSS
jgi:AcrR family transcriptional regulator